MHYKADFYNLYITEIAIIVLFFSFLSRVRRRFNSKVSCTAIWLV